MHVKSGSIRIKNVSCGLRFEGFIVNLQTLIQWQHKARTFKVFISFFRQCPSLERSARLGNETKTFSLAFRFNKTFGISITL